eukprot:351737-Chlamydomonas_euryale.AAC.9
MPKINGPNDTRLSLYFALCDKLPTTTAAQGEQHRFRHRSRASLWKLMRSRSRLSHSDGEGKRRHVSSPSENARFVFGCKPVIFSAGCNWHGIGSPQCRLAATSHRAPARMRQMPDSSKGLAVRTRCPYNAHGHNNCDAFRQSINPPASAAPRAGLLSLASGLASAGVDDSSSRRPEPAAATAVAEAEGHRGCDRQHRRLSLSPPCAARPTIRQRRAPAAPQRLVCAASPAEAARRGVVAPSGRLLAARSPPVSEAELWPSSPSVHVPTPEWQL